jgi:hypothetical protein
MSSPGFSDFRELMDKWDNTSRLFTESDLCLFFRKDDTLYGATETGRITYARMKNPESKEDENWSKEATFSAYDLEKSADGKNTMSVFGKSDLKKIEAISQEDAEKELEKKGKKMPAISEEDQERTYGEE